MHPDDSDWMTTAQAAAELGIKPQSVRDQIKQGRITAKKVHRLLTMVSRAEVERYKREQLGGRGWDKRRAPDHTPSPQAAYQRERRARQKAQQPADAPAEETER